MRRVTVGIPAYNEEHNILNLLQSLEDHQNNKNTSTTTTPGFEISEVIVSDDSSDSTADLVSQFAARSSLKVILFHHGTRRGAAAAWNEIFKQATGELIVLYDADTIPHPSCTEQLVLGIRERVALCASNSIPVQSSGLAGRASIFISNWLRSVRLARLSQYTVMGRAISIDSKVAKNIQIPSEIIAIDLYLQCVVLQAGMDVVYNDNAVVYFKPASSMKDLASQVVRAMNGHNQIKDLVTKLNIGLPAKVGITAAVESSIRDPLGALAVAIGYSVLPFYKSRLVGTSSAKWHTAESSKAIDYQQLKARF